MGIQFTGEEGDSNEDDETACSSRDEDLDTRTGDIHVSNVSPTNLEMIDQSIIALYARSNTIVSRRILTFLLGIVYSTYNDC